VGSVVESWICGAKILPSDLLLPRHIHEWKSIHLPPNRKLYQRLVTGIGIHRLK
jgi:hypothetical protein